MCHLLTCAGGDPAARSVTGKHQHPGAAGRQHLAPGLSFHARGHRAFFARLPAGAGCGNTDGAPLQPWCVSELLGRASDAFGHFVTFGLCKSLHNYSAAFILCQHALLPPCHADVPTLGAIPSGLPKLQLPSFPLAFLPSMLASAGTCDPVQYIVQMCHAHVQAYGAPCTQELQTESCVHWINAAMLAVLGAIDSLLTSLVADSLTSNFHDSDKELRGMSAALFCIAACHVLSMASLASCIRWRRQRRGNCVFACLSRPGHW